VRPRRFLFAQRSSAAATRTQHAHSSSESAVVIQFDYDATSPVRGIPSGHFLRAVRAEKQIYLVSADDSTSVRTAWGWEDEWPRVSSGLIECVRSFALAKQQTK